jgi:hypothetical protein
MNRTDDTLVITNSDLSAAVAARVLDEPTAARLVEFVASRFLQNDSEDERVRLITGFNDIFVSIGLALFFSGVGFFAQGFAYIINPIAAWLLAEIFTRRMRMALPSILLLLIFTFSIFGGCVYFLQQPTVSFDIVANTTPTGALFSSLATVCAAALHWWRFRVPITVAAGVVALIAMIMAGFSAAIPDFMVNFGAWALLPIGLAVFAFAMYFDRQDRARRTQKSDRAFWLHLLAAPLIVHPLVWKLTNIREPSDYGAMFIFVLFAGLSLVALIVDRRALLVSSLTYLGYALSQIFGRHIYGEVGTGFSVFAVGAIVLILSVAWKPLRKLIVATLPMPIQNQIPIAS